MTSEFRIMVSHRLNQKVKFVFRCDDCLSFLSLFFVYTALIFDDLIFLWCIRVGHDLLDEVVIVDKTVQVFHTLQKLGDLVVGELLTQVHHDVTQLGGGDGAIAVFVEDLIVFVYEL